MKEDLIMEPLKIGLVGLGSRGYMLLKETLLYIPEMQISVVCDAYEDRIKQAQDLIEERCGHRPAAEPEYSEVLTRSDIDALIIATSWEHHVPAAIQAMKAGIPVGIEVGGVYSLEECWELVRTYEETKTPFMFMGNCCYGRRELMALNMKEQGVFGDIVHCRGGYMHDLRSEVTRGKENRHYRLRNYLNRNAENYPTHELGPIARILDINHGNRMLTLTSTASISKGMNEYVRQHPDCDQSLLHARFAQGDVVNTVITCAGGETILLTLDTSLPRYYSRDFTVCGTKGMYEEKTDSVFLDGLYSLEEEFFWNKHWGNAKEYEEQYDHPIWKDFLKSEIKGGHGGMDYLVFREFAQCIRDGRPCPIDVYDAASWMCISVLSEQSIAMGGQPVAIPDFTNGRWMTR